MRYEIYFQYMSRWGEWHDDSVVISGESETDVLEKARAWMESRGLVWEDAYTGSRRLDK